MPLDINEGAKGDTLLEIVLSVPESELADYEWIEEGKPYREWLAPAALINKALASIRIESDEGEIPAIAMIKWSD